MKCWVLFTAAVAVSMSALAFDPVDVYIVKFGRGGAAAGGAGIAQANSVGTAAAGVGGGMVAGGVAAVVGTVVNLASPVDQEELSQATVVGLNVGEDGICQPEVITYPFRNLQRDKSILPLRWARLEKNEQGEFVIKAVPNKAAVKRHPCYQQYLQLVKEKSQKFDPDAYYQ